MMEFFYFYLLPIKELQNQNNTTRKLVFLQKQRENKTYHISAPFTSLIKSFGTICFLKSVNKTRFKKTTHSKQNTIILNATNFQIDHILKTNVFI